jgi:predicted transcriptional regulator of viral defense system
MGKILHIDSVRRFIRTTPAFRVKDIEVIVGDSPYSSFLVHYLRKKGEIRRIAKGWYTAIEDPVVSVFAFRPAYLGLQEALSLRNLWEQESNVVIVSASSVRNGIREIMGSKVILHRISHKYFFGFEMIRYDEFYLPVSDVEKTLIDLVYFDELPDRDVLKRLVREADFQKLHRYLSRYSPRFRKRFNSVVKEQVKGALATPSLFDT